MRYKADITAGSLKVAESRVIADLLLRGVNGEDWDSAILDENVLQTRNPETARRLARLIRVRLILIVAKETRKIKTRLEAIDQPQAELMEERNV